MQSLALLFALAGCGPAETDDAAAEAFAEWTAVEDLRIDPATADLTSGGVMLVARNGDILITQSQDNNIRVFKHDGGTATIGRGGGGPGEFRRVIRAGWVGDTLWALDPALSRISYFGPDYAFIRAVQDPSTGQEAGPQNPVVSTFIQAVLPDGALRALASPYPNTPPPPWLADIDENETAVVRLSFSGEHLGRLGVQPDDPCRVSWAIGVGGSGGSVLPFCARPISTDWDASTDLATVWVERSEPDSARYRVELIDYMGDTLIARTLPFTVRPISQFKLDSAMARQTERDLQHRPDYLASRPPLPPATFLPPILALLVGRDGTLWLEEEEELPTHQWLVLSSRGSPLGRVTLPANARVRVAERGMLWATITDEDDLVGIARYRIQ
jgi:hypothetical protein